MQDLMEGAEDKQRVKCLHLYLEPYKPKALNLEKERPKSSNISLSFIIVNWEDHSSRMTDIKIDKHVNPEMRRKDSLD